MTLSNGPWSTEGPTPYWDHFSARAMQRSASRRDEQAGTSTAGSPGTVANDEEPEQVRIIGDPSKMRVQISYDLNSFQLGIRLTDQGSGDAMLAEMDPDLAMRVGEQMFKIG